MGFVKEPIRDKAEAEQIAYKQRWALIEQEKRDKIQEDSKIREGTASTREDSRMSRTDEEIARLKRTIDLLSDNIVRTQDQLRLAESENIPGMESLISLFQKNLAESIYNRQKIIDQLAFLLAHPQ